MTLSTFKANDGAEDSNISTITVAIAANNAPGAVSATYPADEDRILRGRLTATDADGQVLTFTLVSNGSKGTASVTSSTGRFTYTPHPNASGTDTFTFRVSDGIDVSNVATITVNIANTNDAPTVADATLATPLGTALTAAFPASDADGDTLTFTITRSPRNGTLVVNGNGTFTYTPSAGFTGTDSFRFRATDGSAASGQATVTIGVK